MDASTASDPVQNWEIVKQHVETGKQWVSYVLRNATRTQAIQERALAQKRADMQYGAGAYYVDAYPICDGRRFPKLAKFAR